jgi:hypothetical protein
MTLHCDAYEDLNGITRSRRRLHDRAALQDRLPESTQSTDRWMELVNVRSRWIHRTVAANDQR